MIALTQNMTVAIACPGEELVTMHTVRGSTCAVPSVTFG